jgi:hypothetical protein
VAVTTNITNFVNRGLRIAGLEPAMGRRYRLETAHVDAISSSSWVLRR